MNKFKDTDFKKSMRGTNRSRLESSLKDEEPVKVPEKRVRKRK